MYIPIKLFPRAVLVEDEVALRRRGVRSGVIVDVRFPEVFLLDVLVPFMVVGHRRVVVPMRVGRYEMTYILLGAVVVSHVDVLVPMLHRRVIVHI